MKYLKEKLDSIENEILELKVFLTSAKCSQNQSIVKRMLERIENKRI